MAGTDRPKINKGGTARGPMGATARAPMGGTARAPQTGGEKSPEIEEVKPYEEEKQRVQAADVRVLKRDAEPTGQMGEITLNGVTYTVAALVSASTGEAEVYKLTKGGNTYALKLYYAGMSPDAAVVGTLKKITGTGFLVDIIDYGKWTSPQGDVRDFELMPFYTGGELKPGALRGNADALKATAAAMMMAVKVAHDHSILHKDIKPENFMFSDESRTQLLLTDFGIASMFSRDGKGRMIPLKLYAQWRTKIYAAPEIYTVIDNEIEYPDDKSDYYSLGIALLTLWSGDKELESLGERKLLSLKRGESGTLPYPDDMPANMLRLLKGLTVPVSEHRWGWDEFERWVKGEDVPIYGETSKLQNSTTSQLDILYNGRTGERARSLPELAALMIDDKKLAEQYLYTGQIAKWLHEGGYPELEAQVNEYVTRTYPTNREAGVMATAYLLDVDLPFASPSGKLLRTQEEIALDMANNSVKYLPMMSDKDSPLFVYFRSGGVDEYAQKFVPMAKKGHDQAFYAMWRMLLTLDPSAPFPVISSADAKTYTTVSTIDQLVDHFAKIPAYAYAGSKLLEARLLYDEAFIMWLAHRNEALAGRIKSKLAQEKKTDNLYFYIWYLLAPDRNYLLQKDQTKMFTIEQIAEQINSEYVLMSTDKGLTEELQNLKDNRLYYYLKSKEMYRDKFDYIAYCFDLDTKDRRNQCGPYDKWIATFKAIKALNGNAFYYFPKSRKKVNNVEELKAIPIDEQRHELSKGKLKEWLAVEFQEDPFADLSESLTYETLTGEFTDAIAEINPDDPSVERYYDAENTVEAYAVVCRKILRSNRIWRGLFYLLVVLPLVALALTAVFVGFAHFAHPSGLLGWGFGAVSLTILFRIIQIFPKVDEWLLQPFGETLYYKMLLHRWIVSAIYAVAFAAIGYLMEGYPGLSRIVIPALCAVVLIWRWKLTIAEYPLAPSSHDDVLHPDESQVAIESMYFAYHADIKEFDSEIIDHQTNYYEFLEQARNSTVKRTLWSLIPVAALIAWYIPFSPMCENYIKYTDPQRWEKVYGEGTKSQAETAVAEPTHIVTAQSLTVRETPSKNGAKLGSLKKGDKVLPIEITNGWAKIDFDGKEGYVSASYIKETSAQTETVVPTTTAKKAEEEQTSSQTSEGVSHTIVDRLPARSTKMYTIKPNYNRIDVFSAKNTQSQFVIGEIDSHEPFEVLSDDGSWAKINYKGRYAYVRTMNIVPAENQ